MSGKRRSCPLWLAAALLSGSALAAQTAIKLPKNKFTPQQDVELGLKAAAEIRQQYPMIQDGEISRYLASLGDRLGPGLPQADVPAAIRKIVDAYLVMRLENERFLDTYRRLGMAPFKEAVYAEAH